MNIVKAGWITVYHSTWLYEDIEHDSAWKRWRCEEPLDTKHCNDRDSVLFWKRGF